MLGSSSRILTAKNNLPLVLLKMSLKYIETFIYRHFVFKMTINECDKFYVFKFNKLYAT